MITEKKTKGVAIGTEENTANIKIRTDIQLQVSGTLLQVYGKLLKVPGKLLQVYLGRS